MRRLPQQRATQTMTVDTARAMTTEPSAGCGRASGLSCGSAWRCCASRRELRATQSHSRRCLRCLATRQSQQACIVCRQCLLTLLVGSRYPYLFDGDYYNLLVDHLTWHLPHHWGWKICKVLPSSDHCHLENYVNSLWSCGFPGSPTMNEHCVGGRCYRQAWYLVDPFPLDLTAIFIFCRFRGYHYSCRFLSPPDYSV